MDMLLRSSSTRQLHLQLAASIGSQWMERFGWTERKHLILQCNASAPCILQTQQKHCCLCHSCCFYFRYTAAAFTTAVAAACLLL